MKRNSTKKSSNFKLQAEKLSFLNFLEDIRSCVVLKTFPEISYNLVEETSQKIFSYCYSFRQDSPFTKGLNYNCKEIGFSSSQNLMEYRQWLPNISKAYLMGDFNSFNRNSHQLNPVEGMPNWFKLQLNSLLIDDGSRIVLRIIDHQGTQYNMIPPSCISVIDNYGIFIRYRKNPFLENPLVPEDILSYSIDIQKIKLENVGKLIKDNQNILEKFNTIILRNLFVSKKLFYRYTLSKYQIDLLIEILNIINTTLGCKVVIEWNCLEGDRYYVGNPIQQSFISKFSNKYQWALNQDQVFSYFLSYMSFYRTYFNIDGFLITGAQSLTQNVDGMVILKCINIMNLKFSENGITLSLTNKQISGIWHKVLDGGYGIMYGVNTNENIDINSSHIQLVQKISNIQQNSNCLLINFKQSIQYIQLNIYLAFCCSLKGVFCQGYINNVGQILCKILKLRDQSQFFSKPFSIVSINENHIIAERGRAKMFFNYKKCDLIVNEKNFQDYELIFSSKNEPTKKHNMLILQAQSFALYQNTKEQD